MSFRDFDFFVKDGRAVFNNSDLPFVEVQIAGRNKDSHCGAKAVNSSEGRALKYVTHSVDLLDDSLTVVQRSDAVETTTVFKCYSDTDAVRVRTTVVNISDEEITLEEVSALMLGNIAKRADCKNTYFYRFLSSHHVECQPRRFSFDELGVTTAGRNSQKRICGINVGSWSTKEELPQGIIESADGFLMFEIESNNSWYYEISDFGEEMYLYLSGANSAFGGWCKTLKPNESYTTVPVAVVKSDTLDGVIGEMTKYRRHIAGHCAADESLPVIFNEYMHLSWDSPDEKRTRELAPVVKKAGAEYYVIDCGWHDEVDGNIIYPYVGQWKESNARFPGGIRKTTDYIRSLGMKAGLWIEPEIIGNKCAEMLGYYDDDCFLQRHGKRIMTMNRHFLDFRNEKVRSYMSETIRRMVEDYGADYIKTDYNQDCGVGTDLNADSAGEGLEQAAAAYLSWIDEMRAKFPQTLFETCSSGGMRMDYATLSHFSIVSTSDQTNYLDYPCIAANIAAAVLPEQAAVWSYPVAFDGTFKADSDDKKQWTDGHISREQVAMNMVNSFLGRMHLAGDVSLLDEERFSLVKEGVEYFKSLSEIKKRALPVFPLGFAKFGEPLAAGGLRLSDKIYLAVWNMSGEKASVELPYAAKSVKVGYPKFADVKPTIEKNGFTVELNAKSAVALEIELN